MEKLSKKEKNVLLISGGIILAVFIYSYFKKPNKPNVDVPKLDSDTINEGLINAQFLKLPSSVQQKINTIVANCFGERATKKYLLDQYNKGNVLYIDKWYSGVNRRIQKTDEGTVFIYGDTLYDSFYGIQRNKTNIFRPDIIIKAVTSSENGKMSLQPNETSQKTSTIVKGTNLGIITNAFFNKTDNKLYYYIPEPQGAGGIFKYVYAGFVNLQSYTGKTLISETNGAI